MNTCVAIMYIILQTFFCSSLVKGKPTWLYPKKLKFEAKKKELLSYNIDGSTRWNLQMDIFAHFLHFQANLCFCLGSPLT